MITTKQRSYLRSLANKMDAIFQIGKDGLNDNLLKQIDDALEARELIKISVLKTVFIQQKKLQVKYVRN